jgi:transcriptional regulator with XRE-family HTH domain
LIDLGDRFLKILYNNWRELTKNLSMGLVRLRIQEFADKQGWSIKQVSDRSGVPYGTVKTYMRVPKRATVDLTALKKLALTFDVVLEDLFDVVEE